MVWIQQTFPEPVYWAPVGDWNQADWPEILSKHFSGATVFTRIPEKLAEFLCKGWLQNESGRTDPRLVGFI
jgi:hypothetical protein